MRELYGDAAHERVTETLNPAPMLAVARAIVEDKIKISTAGGVRRRDAANAAARLLRKAFASTDVEAVGRALAPLELDRGGFHSWLATAPIDELCGSAPPEPARCEPLARGRRDVTPCEAVSWMTWGEAWSAERVMARIARARFVVNMIADDRGESAHLSETARQRLRQLMVDDEAVDQRFEAARVQLERGIIDGTIETYSAAALRPLTAADFANAVWLDVVHGEFVPSPELVMMSDEWERARRACDEIGQVRLPSKSVLKLTGLTRRKATAASMKRAEENLRMRCETWRRGEAPMPKKSEWVAGDGGRIAGAKHAAGKVWTSVTSSDAAYAPLRHAGRRRRNR